MLLFAYYLITSWHISEFTWGPLSHGLHDNLEFLEGQYAIFVSVEEHEYLLPVSHLYIYTLIRSSQTVDGFTDGTLTILT